VIEIRSFRRVFDLERRIYSVDSVRLNPAGVPVRGIVYFLAILLGALVAGRLPLVGLLVSWVPWYIRDLALPAMTATVLGSLRVEGRPFHSSALALVRYAIQICSPCPLGMPLESSTATVWAPADVVVLADGSESRMRRIRYTGPGSVIVSVEHERGPSLPRRLGPRLYSCSTVTLRERAGPPLTTRPALVLDAGAQVLVRRPRRRAPE
jgi:hypothetical protein